MILLDTNVVSEAWRPEPSPDVVAWLDAQDSSQLALTATVAAELLTGVARLPDGRRKSALARNVEGLLARLSGRVLPFDLVASRHYARLVVRASAAGVTVSQADAEIAAVASALGAVVATRDTEPFVAMGVPVINPWEASAMP